MTLSEKNRRVHARLSELYALFVEALLRCEGEIAEERWSAFHTALHEHAGLEESRVLPLAEELAVTGKGDPRVIRHDHRLLDQAMENTAKLLADLRAGSPDEWIGGLARNLETLARFEQIFEHHTVRECDFLYTAFDALEGEEGEAMRAKVGAVLEKSLA